MAIGRDRQGAAATLLAGLLLVMVSGSAWAADPVVLVIRGHRFVPDNVSVPAGERFRIEVTNEDATPEEFESSELKIEKIVVPGGKIAVMAGPLKPGSYRFFGDYHPDETHGALTAVAP